MKIITNPPFRLFSNKKKLSSQMIFNHCNEYVVLATFKYCNNVLGNVEYIEPEEWPEIFNCLGIAYSGNTYVEEKPEFIKCEVRTSPPKESCYVAVKCRPNCWSALSCKKNGYKNLDDILLNAYDTSTYIVSKQDERFSTIVKQKAGEIKSIVCYKIDEQLLRKYWDKIWLDTHKWSCAMKKECILIRKEFVDEDNNKSSILK